MSRVLTLTRGVVALVVLGALTVGVPWLLVATVGNPYPAEGLSLSGRLTDNAILGLLAVLGWIVWAQLVVCVLIEVIAEVRHALGRSAEWLTNVPGTFNGQQQIARLLVQTVVAAVVGTGVTHPVVAGSTAVVAAPRVAASAHGASAESPKLPSRKAQEVAVGRGDTLWSLAERHLGAGERWREIAELNAGRTMVDGQRFAQAETIQPGWRLLVPTVEGSSGHDEGNVIVERGDTLWDLSEEEYGEGQRWPRLYRANREEIADPDLIFPGQVLDVPGQRQPQEQPPERPSRAPMHDERPGREAPAPAHPAPSTPSPSEEQVAPEPSASDPDITESQEVTDEHDAGLSLVAALTGGGALLGAGLLSLLLVRRRMQYRVRRSGRMVAQTPVELTTRRGRDPSRRLGRARGRRVPRSGAARARRARPRKGRSHRPSGRRCRATVRRAAGPPSGVAAVRPSA